MAGIRRDMMAQGAPAPGMGGGPKFTLDPGGAGRAGMPRFAETPGIGGPIPPPPQDMSPWLGRESAVAAGGPGGSYAESPGVSATPSKWALGLMSLGSGLMQTSPLTAGLGQGMQGAFDAKYGRHPMQLEGEERKRKQQRQKMLTGAYGKGGGGSDAAAAMAEAGDSEGARQAYKLSFEQNQDEEKMAKAQEALRILLESGAQNAKGKPLSPQQVQAAIFLSQFDKDQLARAMGQLVSPTGMPILAVPGVE